MNPTPPRPPPSGADGATPRAAPDAASDRLSPVQHEALRWSVRVANGIDVAEQARLAVWRAAAPEHEAAYAEFAGVWAKFDELPDADVARLRSQVAIERAAEVPSRPSGPSTARPPVPPRLRRRAVGLAAAAGVLVLGAVVWPAWQAHRQTQPVFAQRYQTQPGQQMQVPLPDGSCLVLDVGTTAEVAFYRARREVRLPEGQVVFEVKVDSERPFDVLAGAARVRVVGTTFSVRYTPALGSGAVEVGVIEGRVQVAGVAGIGQKAAATAQDAVALGAGQTVVADAEGRLGAVFTGSPAAIGGWQQGRLNFQDVTLDRVVAELARYGWHGLRLADPAVGRLAVTASVDLRRIDDFVRSLPKVLPMRLERAADGVWVVRGEAGS